MATYSFPAVAIFDSTATGRSLITAADQAAARAAIGIDPSDYGLLDSDNTWTGDNTFDEPISAGDGSVTAPSYSFGSQSTMGIYRVATNQINMIAAAGGYGFNLQSASLSISSTMAFGWRSASNISQGHSYDTLLARDATGIIAQRNFFNNAAQAFRVYGTWTNASNGEWIQIDHGVTNSTKSTIASMANGTGTVREVQLVSGNSSVEVKQGLTTVKAGGQNLLRGSGAASTYLYSFNNGTIIDVGDGVLSAFSANCDLGSTTKRWATTYSVDGSYSGNLNVESGGSFKLFNLGDSHTNTTNTEYLETVVDTGIYCIRTGATGTGTAIKKVYVGTGFGGTNVSRGITISNSDAKFNFGGARFTIAGGAITSYAKLIPSGDGVYSCGEDGKRWSNVVSVDGDFSGNMTLSNLPTSDPAVAGQLWNDSGTLKISAG